MSWVAATDRLGRRCALADQEPEGNVGVIARDETFSVPTVGTWVLERESERYDTGNGRHLRHRADAAAQRTASIEGMKSMYKRILVAIDGSDTSSRALREAIALTKEQDAKLRVIHVMDQVPAFISAETSGQLLAYHEAMRQAGEELLAIAKAEAAKSNIDAEIKLIVIESLATRTPDAIEQEASEWPAELIVIGTHGRRGVRRLLLGSVAEGVARAATKPVLLVRAT
jgi:nucleotide-binding universal stress UspA family protein